MPLAGYTCPPGTPTAGTRNSIEHCLGKCPHPCVSPPLLAAIYQAEQRNHHQGNYVSASMIAGGGCKRQTVYERYTPFYEVPRRRYWPFRGTLAHRIVEDAGGVVEPFGWVQELRMSVPLHFPELPKPIFDENGVFTGQYEPDGYLVLDMGGTTDAYKIGLTERDADGWATIDPTKCRLDDYKTMADAKADMVIRGTKGGSFNKNVEDYWVWQTNIYSWLISKTPISRKWRAQLKKFKIKVPRGMTHFPRPTEIHIQGIGMMEIPLTGMPYMPQRARESYDIEAIPTLPIEEVEQYIREGALLWYKYLVLREELPPVVPKDEGWKCKNCPFNGDIIEGAPCHPGEAWAAADAERAAARAASGEQEPVQIDKPKRRSRKAKEEPYEALSVAASTDLSSINPTGPYPWEKPE